MTRSVTAVAGGAVGGLLVDAIGAGQRDRGRQRHVRSQRARARADARRCRVRGRSASGSLHELAVGWREVRARRWVWMTILNASLFLMLYVAPFEVIGPIVSRESLGGAIAWGADQRQLRGRHGGRRSRLDVHPPAAARVLCLVDLPGHELRAAAARPCRAGGRSSARAYALDGVAVGVFVAVWETTLQREIPSQVLSRVSAWDWMGSLAGMPLGFALTGPPLAVIGER